MVDPFLNSTKNPLNSIQESEHFVSQRSKAPSNKKGPKTGSFLPHHGRFASFCGTRKLAAGQANPSLQRMLDCEWPLSAPLAFHCRSLPALILRLAGSALLGKPIRPKNTIEYETENEAHCVILSLNHLPFCEIEFCYITQNCLKPAIYRTLFSNSHSSASASLVLGL